jgi:ribonuclease P protein component
LRAARFGLGADRRITRRTDFDRLLQSGARRSRGGYTFYLARRPQGTARLGILISLKHSSMATVRNRIKRCIREAFRLEHARLGGLDLLVRPPYGLKPGPGTVEQLRQLLVELKT